MLSLGINFAHDRGAALICDGTIVRAISQERLDRKKHSSAVTIPWEAIDYCLGDKYSRQDMDVVVYNYPHHGRMYPVVGEVNEELKKEFWSNPIFLPHHLAHAYSTFYASPFDEAVVLVVDGAGNKYGGQAKKFFDGHLRKEDVPTRIPGAIEAETGYYFTDKNWSLLFKRWQTRAVTKESWSEEDRIIWKGEEPWTWGPEMEQISLGRMYWETCVRLKMGLLDGGKLMGMSAYGLEGVEASLLNCGSIAIGFNIDLQIMRNYPHGIFKEKARLAYKVQNTLEQLLIALARMLHTRQKCPNLCLAGGVALNSIANEKIIKTTPFQKIFITPASNDTGIPLGCAYYGYCKGCRLRDRVRVKYTPYTGRSYSDIEIRDALEGLDYCEISYPQKEVAKYLTEGKVIGWFQGGSEYGPRALGNRSILCDPRNKFFKDVLNIRVKHREFYRPFAPAVLAERVGEFFKVIPDSGGYEYMLRIVEVRPEKREVLGAVTHVDGTARVQTVTAENNRAFYDLISEFNKLTGVPVVLNTSFNVAKEPIVESPKDAVDCFLKTAIDVLVMGSFVVERDKQNFGVKDDSLLHG